jgi:hypothetical protein
MLTHNQQVLAKLLFDAAMNKARNAHLQPPQTRVMDALGEAIESKRNELEALILAGKLDTDAYRKAKAQLASWTDAWRSNR